MTAERSDEATVRAKYHDWCSARIADRFLELSPEEVYRLAQEVSAGAPDRAGDAPLSYRAQVERVTEVLAGRMELPSFAEWATLYGSDPARYESELFGFWKLNRTEEGGGDEARPADQPDSGEAAT
jgi:hypothetical protein